MSLLLGRYQKIGKDVPNPPPPHYSSVAFFCACPSQFPGVDVSHHLKAHNCYMSPSATCGASSTSSATVTSPPTGSWLGATSGSTLSACFRTFGVFLFGPIIDLFDQRITTYRKTHQWNISTLSIDGANLTERIK